MRKTTGEALGFLETLGMVPAIFGADSMLKAANVQLTSYENVGSTLVTIMVAGDVAAVRASVEAGVKSAGEIGKVTAHNVIPRPIKGVSDVVAVHAVEEAPGNAERPKALGMIETFGIVILLEAADAMVKAADVQLVGYENVASGYCSVLVEGDVAACQAAVSAGVQAVRKMGADIYSSCVIPSPHPALPQMTKRYALENLLP